LEYRNATDEESTLPWTYHVLQRWAYLVPGASWQKHNSRNFNAYWAVLVTAPTYNPPAAEGVKGGWQIGLKSGKEEKYVNMTALCHTPFAWMWRTLGIRRTN